MMSLSLSYYWRSAMTSRVLWLVIMLLGNSSFVGAQTVESVAERENGLDKCAGTIALELDKRSEFIPNQWPIFCHQNRNHPLIVERVVAISADLASGRYTEGQIAALREGQLPIGAPREAAFYLYGAPRTSSRKTTAEGVEEVMVFRFLDGPVPQRVVTNKAGLIFSIEE